MPPFEIWPENMEAFDIFCALQTQWHRVSGLGGVARTGLIYTEAVSYMRERGVKPAEGQSVRARRFALLEDLRVMERAALETWNSEPDSDG